MKNKAYLGLDPARLGGDSAVFIGVEHMLSHLGEIKVFYIEEKPKSLITELAGRTLILDRKFNFNTICIDATGLGGGVIDILDEFKMKLGMKVQAITFTNEIKKDMYDNLRILMEKGKLIIPNYKKLIYQLMSTQYEINRQGRYIFKVPEGENDDFVTALALACYAPKLKPLYVPVGA